MNDILSINLKNTEGFVPTEEVLALAQQSVRHLEMLKEGTGAGSDFLGWLTLPGEIATQFDKIEKKAKQLRSVTDTTVVIGIGGSYLGAKAVIEALSHSFTPLLKKKHHEIIFAIHDDLVLEPNNHLAVVKTSFFHTSSKCWEHQVAVEYI